MKSRFTIAAAALLMFASAPLAVGAQTQVLTFTPSGAVGANFDQSVGWQFNVLSGLNVNGLSWFDDGVAGLSVAHTVGIWSPTGTLLASALIPAGTLAALNGGYRTVSITNVFLAVGTGYIIGGQNFANSTDQIQANVTSQTVNPSIAFVDATFSVGTGFTRPDQFSAASTGFYGPGFTTGPVTTTPEPGTYALVATGLVGLGALRRRRRA